MNAKNSIFQGDVPVDPLAAPAEPGPAKQHDPTGVAERRAGQTQRWSDLSDPPQHQGSQALGRVQKSLAALWMHGREGMARSLASNDAPRFHQGFGCDDPPLTVFIVDERQPMLVRLCG